MCSVNSSHRVTSFTEKLLCVLLIHLTELRLSLRNCSVFRNSSHRVTAFHSRSLSLRLFFWNLESDM
ncbi:hypothetical protein CP02DC14_2249 [Chlamydia psittaci 02DC14]|nr:hypothetical protein CP02DC14_2249 [Chlamydia psittaci 02DC14]